MRPYPMNLSASKPIVEVRGLSKLYHLGSLGSSSLRDAAEVFLSRLRKNGGATSPSKPQTAIEPNRAGPEPNSFWALKDVSFDVQQGEVVGIIGGNGAGKSTLLKILSRITEPTEGRAVLRGRVASLLEVGTGFHPELTGRENIFLNGAILGMKRAEIARKFDEIVSFAEVDAFIDTPVKRYSSGMYVRLAFAVAAHLEPEILIIDEVLAVGDIGFQKKCLGKMQDVATREGRTVLFVTHNMQAVRHMCQRAVLIEDGRVGWLGDVVTAINRYAGNPEGHASRIDLDRMARNNTGFAARLRTLEFLDENGTPIHRVERAHELRARITFDVREPIRAFDLAMAVTHSGGERVFSESFTDQRKPQPLAAGRYFFEFAFPAHNLKPEAYFLTLLCLDGSEALDFVEGMPLPEIADPNGDSFKESRRWGVVRIPVTWSTPEILL